MASRKSFTRSRRRASSVPLRELVQKSRYHADVIVVGAGAAGLTAASDLGRAGLSVLILEARSRIGGRIFTQRDPATGAPIELGAEFIHGLPPEIWEPLQARNTRITEVEGSQWCHQDGALCECRFFSQIDKILKKMDDRVPDESFLSFLRRCSPESGSAKQEETNRRAIAYVSGFNAADPDRVGVHWLVQGMRSEEKIEGDRAFHSEHGYSDLLEILRQNVADARGTIQTGSVVELIRWKQNSVEVHIGGEQQSILSARKVLVTLPVGVLQARPGERGAVRFDPELPDSKHEALRRIAMGKVIRVTLCFKTRFWDALPAPGSSFKTLADMSFLFTEDQLFPTWWTTMPRKLPIITGWAPFRAAERLSGKDPGEIVQEAVSTLGNLLAVPGLANQLDVGYVHDWQSDPFARGAYSYGLVGGDGAQAALATPLNNTLFFAGEATETTGLNGTVHAAIATGHRAAREVLSAT